MHPQYNSPIQMVFKHINRSPHVLPDSLAKRGVDRAVPFVAPDALFFFLSFFLFHGGLGYKAFILAFFVGPHFSFCIVPFV